MFGCKFDHLESGQPLDVVVLPHSFGEHHLRAVWRVSLGLGVIPALAVLIWRINMDEPTRYKSDSIVHGRTPYWLIFRRYWMSFTGIAITWFIYDFITYVVLSRRARFSIILTIFIQVSRKSYCSVLSQKNAERV